MPSHSGSWRWVPETSGVAWRDLFARHLPSPDPASPCPLCGARTLHQHFLLWRAEPTWVERRLWAGRGSHWAWCSACLHYEHAQALVPLNWPDRLHVPMNGLGSHPEALERARLHRDIPLRASNRSH